MSGKTRTYGFQLFFFVATAAGLGFLEESLNRHQLTGPFASFSLYGTATLLHAAGF